MFRVINLKGLINYALAIAIIIAGVATVILLNKPLEYDFASVYDASNGKHTVNVYTSNKSKRYATRCADELADSFIKAKIGNYDISIVKNGEYELVYYNSRKVK